MRLTRDSITFERFLWYLKGGFLVFLIVLTISLFWGGLMWWEKVEKTNIEYDFYAVLRGEEVQDAKIREIKDFLVDYNKGNTEQEKLKMFAAILLDSKTRYADVLTEKWDNVQLILRKAPGSENIKVRVATWSEFFVLFGLAQWLFMNFCFSFSYLYGSDELRLDDSESALAYPWKKLWSYPFIPVMLPFLLVSQPILFLFAISRVCSDRNQSRSQQGFNRLTVRTQWQNPNRSTVRPQCEIDADRERFRRAVGSAKKKESAAKRAWIILCGKIILCQKQALEKETNDCRNELSRLGQRIEDCQRGLAKAQAKLRDIDRTIETKTSDRELGMDFDKIGEIPKVLAIEVEKTEIIVYTDTFYVDYAGKRYELGNYLLRIGIAEELFVRAENQCNTSNCGSHHPYTYPSGSSDICSGRLTQYINELLRSREYFALIVVLMQTLQSADGDRPEKVTMWKEVTVS